MTFSYQYATEEQIVEHLKTSSRQAIHAIIKHYTRMGDTFMLEKILRAKVLMKVAKKQAKTSISVVEIQAKLPAKPQPV